MTVSWPSQKDLLAWIENDLNNWGRWGDDDERGTMNLITAEKTREAASLVRKGITDYKNRGDGFNRGMPSRR